MNRQFIFILSAVGLFSLLSMAPACPPQPVPPTPGSGGSPGTGGSPNAAGSQTDDGGAFRCQQPGTFCCAECAVLVAHECHEEVDRTPNEAGCEERCNSAASLVSALHWPDVTACTALSCIREPKAGKRGIACAGGK